MRRYLVISIAFLLLALWFSVGVLMLILDSRQPRYSGVQVLPGLQERVEVKFDKWGIPHIEARTEADAYHVLGYLHAQERLFQMEMLRRIALGKVSEVMGPDYLATDRLFRTLRLRQTGEAVIARQDTSSPAMRAAQAYLDGVNHFVEVGNTPLEFQLAAIPKRPFQLADFVSIGGYQAYSFAQGFRIDPLQTFVKQKFGDRHLADLGAQLPAGQNTDAVQDEPAPEPERDIWEEFMNDGSAALPLIEALAALQQEVDERLRHVPTMVGSNAWAMAGERTASGKPILANDPHVAYAQPSVWWEAHLVVQPEGAEQPSFEIYGHHMAGSPFAMLGHNHRMGWGVTMLMNDDLDLYVEQVNPENEKQVRYRDGWYEITVENEIIHVKGGAEVLLPVRSTPHGPIINDVFSQLKGQGAPVALRWAYHDDSNQLLSAFYELAHAENMDEAREAVSGIHAPGLNIVYADADGNIGWWAAARIPWRDESVNPGLMLDGADPANQYDGYWEFAENPQEENPASGVLISANQLPHSINGRTVWGYYNIPERARRLDQLLNARPDEWTLDDMQSVQLDTRTDYYASLRRILPVMIENHLAGSSDVMAAEALSHLWEWDGSHNPGDVAPTIFQEFLYQFLQLVYRDELGDALFDAFLKSKLVDRSFAIVLNDPDSPWWDDVNTPQQERKNVIVGAAWDKTMQALRSKLGGRPGRWTWSRAHTLTHIHPIGSRPPFGQFFNVGPFQVAGGRETINNLSNRLEGAVHNVHHGPSTRRLIDFAEPGRSRGINPTGQSGYFMSPHYDDQAWLFATGQYRAQLLDGNVIHANRRGQIDFMPR